ncbi:unnamed protein product [Closterium sp. NIES-64]|nr:unnamed protein product [Closterium sp. NIES-64]
MQMINSWFQGGPSFRDEPVSLMDSWRAYEAQGGGLDMESGEVASSSGAGGGGSSGGATASGIPGLSFDAFTPYFQNASDSVNATWSSVSKNVQELPGSIQKQANVLPSRKALMYFVVVLATGVFFLFLAFSMFLPVIVLAPQKFAVCFTIGCLLVVGSFFVLKGPMVQLQSMTSAESFLVSTTLKNGCDSFHSQATSRPASHGRRSSPRLAVRAAAKTEDDPAAKALQAKSLGELRAMAREKGLRGDTKAELVKLLLQTQPSSSSPVYPSAVIPPRESTHRPTTLAPTAASSTASGVSGSKGGGKGGKAEAAKALEAMSTAQLRAMAREKGLRGDTRAELINLLVAALPQSAKPTSNASVMPRPLPPSASPAAAAAAAAASGDGNGASSSSRESEVAEAEVVLPPFASDIPPGGIAISQVQPKVGSGATAKEVKEAAAELKQGQFVRSVLIGGFGLALVPLVLPLAPMNRLVPGSPAEQLAAQLGEEATVLLNSLLDTQAVTVNQLQALMPLISPDLDPTTRAARAAWFCQQVPPAARSEQAEKFCKTVAQIGIRAAAQ